MTQFFVEYAMQVLGAIIILAIGYFVANKTSRLLVKFLDSKDIDATMSQLIGSSIYFGVLFCFIVIALGKFGISITPFVAALGAFTLGAGFAIQGVVSNYGAGLSIIFARHFVVGNTLTVQNVSGVVEEIRLAYTVLKTEDGERITVPNKEIIGQILENTFENRLVETIFMIETTADPRRTIRLLLEALGNPDYVASKPALQVGIDDFSQYGIKIGVRCWVPTSRYMQCKYDINAVIYETLEKAAIRLSIPIQEIRMLQD